MTPRKIAACTRKILLAAMLAGLAACGGNALYREGMDLFASGKQEEGLAKLAQANRESPKDLVIEQSYRNARGRVVGRLIGEAQAQKAAGQLAAAEALYRRSLGIDPDNVEAQAGLVAVEQGRGHARMIAEARALMDANALEEARQKVAQVLKENAAHFEARALGNTIEERIGNNQSMASTLKKTFQTPVTIEFRDANLKQVLEALSRHSGLNFIVDKDVPPSLMVTVFLRNVSVLEALDLILVTNQLKQRVLNDSSILVYPDTAAKLGDHQELVVRNFFLTNAEAKQVATMLKTVLKVTNVYADDKLNLLMMRDTPAMIKLAERLISTQDVAEPEVMLEVAVMEVSRTHLTTLGIQLPNQLSLTPLASGSVLTLKDLQNLTASTVGATVGSLILNVQDDTGAANLLANPRIRTHNREKALIRIGDRVPIITTTATATGFVSENVQYVDVGLKLEVEPIIYPNDEIVIKLALEVSSVVKEIVSKAGTISYQIGGRNASTVLRLKDGETQILGGLINDEDRRTANGIAGLSQMPILGRLFSSEKDNRVKSELVLSITPRIVKALAPPAQVPREFWSGTENAPRLRVQPAPREGADSGKGDVAPPLPAAPVSATPPAEALATGLPPAAGASDGSDISNNAVSKPSPGGGAP